MIDNELISKKKTRTNNEEDINSEEEVELNIQNNKLNKKHLQKQKNTNYRLIEPYRSLGIVIDDNKVVYYKRAHDRFLLCSNNNSFLLYNLEHLRLERISPPLPSIIKALAMYKNKIFTSVENKVLLWDKIHIVKEYISEDDEEIVYLHTFDKLLLALDSKGTLFIWDIYSAELLKSINLSIDSFIHPSTYLNKILFTKKRQRYEEELEIKSSKIYLYNINTEKQIFEFDFEIDGTVTCIEQSPVVDIVGLGFSTGEIILFNLRTFKKILRFKADTTVDNISFSNCVELNLSLLATSTTNGHINIWDLNKNTLHYTIHAFSNISSLVFLPNEPILLATSGVDNYIRMYRFEYNTGIPVLLRHRNGHSKHPNKIRFYGESVNNDSNHLLSISDSEMRIVSLINEHISKDISFKNLPKSVKFHTDKMHLTDFDFNEFRERDWSNILAVQNGSLNPLLVSYENGAVSEILTSIKSDSICTCVNISICGNFGFAGFENGNIEKFNMQSGLHRWIIDKAHGEKVIDLKSDGINSMLVSISTDMTMKFWDIFQATIIKTIQLEAEPCCLEINRDNDLIAVSLLNGDIDIYDKSNFKLVRLFKKNGGYSKINDICFSKDGKWLLSVTDDRCLRIYDIISGNLIEWVQFKETPVSVTISPSNQYIAISYEDKKGIYIWLNRSLYLDFVDVAEVKEPISIILPSNNQIRTIKTRKDLVEEENLNKEETKAIKDNLSNKIIDENMNLINLSKENKVKYKIIHNLEEIQERNDPKIKKKEKSKAPFFLFNINDIENNKDNSPEFLNVLKNYTHFKNEKAVEGKNELVLKILLSKYADGLVRGCELTLFLNSINPYIVDLEIRNLDPILNMDNKYLNSFLIYIYEELKTRSNFELVQAYLNRFLKV
jgi:U3 small nucleolar RNA-associated protein 21